MPWAFLVDRRTHLTVGLAVEPELVPRTRRPLAEIAFGARYGDPLEL